MTINVANIPGHFSESLCTLKCPPEPYTRRLCSSAWTEASIPICCFTSATIVLQSVRSHSLSNVHASAFILMESRTFLSTTVFSPLPNGACSPKFINFLATSFCIGKERWWSKPLTQSFGAFCSGNIPMAAKPEPLILFENATNSSFTFIGMADLVLLQPILLPSLLLCVLHVLVSCCGAGDVLGVLLSGLVVIKDICSYVSL